MAEQSEETQTSNSNRESRLRSILKAFTWRIIASATTIAVAFFVTGDIKAAGIVGMFDFILKLLLYYFHERAWQLLPRGSIRRIIQPFSRS